MKENIISRLLVPVLLDNTFLCFFKPEYYVCMIYILYRSSIMLHYTTLFLLWTKFTRLISKITKNNPFFLPRVPRVAHCYKNGVFVDFPDLMLVDFYDVP